MEKPVKIVSVGGGPAGLYLSILAKQLDPGLDVTVMERNPPDATFGWGVVFSDETLGNLGDADAVSYAAIRSELVHWDDIHVFYGGQKVVSTGHGFCGMSRLRLLQLLQQRARDVGVKLVFEKEITDPPSEIDADLIVVADGVNSAVRTRHQDVFLPQLDWRRCKFTWLGADLRLPAFTFIFKENQHGLFQVHAYPFDSHRSTFIVECRQEVWRAAGLDDATEAQTIAYMQDLFGPFLNGAALLSNHSIWRTFPTVRNAQWVHGNMVLMGDAAHTAHFSIGSGTKLAMEDGIVLVDCLKEHREKGVAAVLDAYQQMRKPQVERLQRAAQTSLEWFENSGRYMRMHPQQLTFSLMTRSKRITYENLRMRDPALVCDVTSWFAQDQASHGTTVRADGSPRTPAFTPYTVRGCTLSNRLVVSPMCQYSATNGTVDDWHLVHLGSRAVGGAGLVMAEATAVSAAGRITPGCAGIYTDQHIPPFRRIVDFVHTHSASKIGLQLGHAGRKASSDLPWKGGRSLTAAQGAWETLAPSAVPYDQGWHTPKEMTRADMDGCVADHAAATARALAAGFDWLELHMAHGYLLASFLSPLTNRRTDGFGGPISGRLRFPLEVLDAVRAAWPADRPLSVRISATDWVEDGFSDVDRLEVARALHAHGMDILDCSGGGTVPNQNPVYGRMFQLAFADHVRHGAGVPVMTVGNIKDVDQCHTIVAAGRADLCMMARAHLEDPYLALHAAAHFDEQDEVAWPRQYLAVKPGRRKG